MSDNAEFRIILTPRGLVAAAGGQAIEWNVRLQKCPILEEIGDKGTTTSKFKKELLAQLRSEAFQASEPLLTEAGRKVWDSLMTPDLRAAFNSCHRQVVEMAHGTMRIVVVAF